MAVSLLDRIPVDDITSQAREVHFWRTVLTVVAAVLFGAGWVAAKVLTGLWLGVAWAAVAVREGWREGRRATVTHGAA